METKQTKATKRMRVEANDRGGYEAWAGDFFVGSILPGHRVGWWLVQPAGEAAFVASSVDDAMEQLRLTDRGKAAVRQ